MFTSSISPDQHLCVPGCGGFMASRGPAGPHAFAWFVWWLTTLLSMSILHYLCKALSECHCNPKHSSLSLFVLSAFFLGSWNWIFFAGSYLLWLWLQAHVSLNCNKFSSIVSAQFHKRICSYMVCCKSVQGSFFFWLTLVNLLMIGWSSVV